MLRLGDGWMILTRTSASVGIARAAACLPGLLKHLDDLLCRGSQTFQFLEEPFSAAFDRTEVAAWNGLLDDHEGTQELLLKVLTEQYAPWLRSRVVLAPNRLATRFEASLDALFDDFELDNHDSSPDAMRPFSVATGGSMLVVIIDRPRSTWSESMPRARRSGSVVPSNFDAAASLRRCARFARLSS